MRHGARETEPPTTDWSKHRSRWPQERRHGQKLKPNRNHVSRRVKRKHRRAGK